MADIETPTVESTPKPKASAKPKPKPKAKAKAKPKSKPKAAAKPKAKAKAKAKAVVRKPEPKLSRTSYRPTHHPVPSASINQTAREAERTAELQAERDEHNRRTGDISR